MTRYRVDITNLPINVSSERLFVSDNTSGCIAVFEGVTRDAAFLRIEAYEPMALKLLEDYAADSLKRFNLNAVSIVHRLGDVPTGEASLVVAISAAHRSEGFPALDWLVSSIKADVPIWKQEVELDGDTRWARSEQLSDKSLSIL